MKKYLTHSLTLVSGIVIGIIIMGCFSMRASHMYLEVFRINYEQEQEMLAAHARRDGKLHWELGYRKNVADISPPNILQAFDDTKATWVFGFPFGALILEQIGDYPNRKRANKIYKGTKLARLADTLDRLGMKNEAALKWKEAAQLMGHNDVEKAQAQLPMWHGIENKLLEIKEDSGSTNK